MWEIESDIETDEISFNYCHDYDGSFPTEANERRESIDALRNEIESENIKTRACVEQLSKPDESGEEKEPRDQTGRHETTETSSTDETSGEESGSTGLESGFSDLDVNDDEGKCVQTSTKFPPDSDCIETGVLFDEMIYAKDEDGDTLLHLSIILGDKATHLSLNFINLTRDKDCLNTFNKLLQTPLHLAVLSMQITVIRALVKAGALMDLRDKQGRTPFHVACEIDKIEIVEILLSSPHMRPSTSPFRSPNAKVDNTDAISLDIKNYTGETCLHISTKRPNREMVNLLLSHGADVNFPDGKSNRTALHFASEVGNVEMVEILVQQEKIKINCKTLNGETPIVLAYIRDHRKVVKSLKKRTKLNLKEVKKYADKMPDRQ